MNEELRAEYEQTLINFNVFAARCEAEEYTDTGDAWYWLGRLKELLHQAMDQLEGVDG